MKLIVLGLSITSSWGNGHATTFRGLLREFACRGHEVHFLERDVPWYANHRDAPQLPGVRISLYGSLGELDRQFAREVRRADAVIVGSYVPEGVAVGEWVIRTARGVTAFYDIDTPVTLAKLRRGDHEYLAPELIAKYQIYLSFTGGPTLSFLEQALRSPCARPLYCSVDPAEYRPEKTAVRWDLGYLGTYSPDRQPGVERHIIEPARRWTAGRFIVAGPQYPCDVDWPPNVERIDHLPPARHRTFYNQQRFTLNVTRADMITAGYSPSVRLFEAGACGTPVISDVWDGLESFFAPGEAILVTRSPEETLDYLKNTTEGEAARIGASARARVMAHHTAAKRAEELEGYLLERVETRGARPIAAPRFTQSAPARRSAGVVALCRHE